MMGIFGGEKHETRDVGTESSTALTLASSQDSNTSAAVQEKPTTGLRLGATGLNALYLRANAGAIQVEAHDGTDIIIEAPDYDPAVSQIEARIRGDELFLSMKSNFSGRKPWQALFPARVGLQLKVPRGISVRCSTTSGNISVQGVEGDVVLDTHRGRIDVDAPCRSLAVLTETGDADLRGLVGTLSFKAASGSLAATWVGAPDAGVIDIKKSKGSTELSLPADARLNLRFILGPVAILNEFEHDASAPLALHVTTRSGNLGIRKGNRHSTRD